MNNSNYPLGAEYDSSAPYNQKEKEFMPLDITISITLSKTFRVKTNDYEDIELSDGSKSVSFDNCDVKSLAEDIETPFDITSTVKNTILKYGSKAEIAALKEADGWTLDEYEVINER